MSAREDLIYRITRHCSAETAEQMVDAFAAEVLNAAADKLALALTSDGPSLPGYPLAVRSAVRELRRMAAEEATS
jgi:hypothetical protein